MKEKVKCPHCGQRLFDAAIEGELEIKCSRCKTTVALTFKKNEAQLVLGEKKIPYIVKTR